MEDVLELFVCWAQLWNDPPVREVLFLWYEGIGSEPVEEDDEGRTRGFGNDSAFVIVLEQIVGCVNRKDGQIF
ncbi:unnamed protein product [Enterobius vermicularis]|uniref:Rab-GAP TBC domain-containing protein n=1 Tax=Enterobius vermicularis TaxID=51028 RepID=A0A0N4UY20_ENTVE|nr:unnamed protein product [Enterobius vermicularis]